MAHICLLLCSFVVSLNNWFKTDFISKETKNLEKKNQEIVVGLVKNISKMLGIKIIKTAF